MKHTRTLFLSVTLVAAVLGAANLLSCGNKDSKTTTQATTTGNKLKVAVTAQGLAALSSKTTLAMANRALGLAAAPDDVSANYDGVGVNYGESVVDGLKIKLTGMSLTGIPGVTTGPQTPTLEVFNWKTEPKEISIEAGLNEKLEQTVEVNAQAGTYKAMAISLRNSYKVKAYAYLDSDNDTVIDTTIYTTAAGIKKETGRILPAAFVGYDYYEYKVQLIGAAKNEDESANEIGGVTIFPQDVVIAADSSVTTTAADGMTKTISTAGLSVNLCIDTFRILKAWNGSFGTGASYIAGNGSIPFPVYPFPKSSTDKRLSDGPAIVKFFPENQPNFGLGDYIPMFAFANQPAVKAEVYVVSKTANITPFNTQVFTVVTDTAGTPIIGKFSLGEGNETLHIGAAARIFTQTNTDAANPLYSFATDYGTKDANGVDDGGLYYSNDITRAGHKFTDFKRLAAVGDTGTMIMNDGPRCNAQYNYCVGASGVTAYYKRMR